MTSLIVHWIISITNYMGIVLGTQDQCYNDLFCERKMGESDIYILIITSRCFCGGVWVVFTNISYGSWCYTGRMAYNTSKLYISSVACLIFISNYTLLCKSYKYQTPGLSRHFGNREAALWQRLEQLLYSCESLLHKVNNAKLHKTANNNCI